MELIFGTALINAWIVYNSINDDANKLPKRQFVEQLIEAFTKNDLDVDTEPTPNKPHHLEKRSRKRRCVGCYEKLRTFLSSREADKKAKKILTEFANNPLYKDVTIDQNVIINEEDIIRVEEAPVEIAVETNEESTNDASAYMEINDFSRIVFQSRSSETTIDESIDETGDTENNNSLMGPSTSAAAVSAPVTQKSTDKSRRRPTSDLAEQQMSTAFSQLTNALRKRQSNPSHIEDECDLYGKLLAKKIRELPNDERK
ncbi:unnamed protein product [Arctia plantaginis]|uniref:Uncharacterized protein n=1 Tax=Arctia plantaginis TaxID=874455 RepID=A0A8S0ZCJ0_ARCPL|nr:unnamed protein product [Arctia plantaginis]